jgi:hypothetical protein
MAATLRMVADGVLRRASGIEGEGKEKETRKKKKGEKGPGRDGVDWSFHRAANLPAHDDRLIERQRRDASMNLHHLSAYRPPICFF